MAYVNILTDEIRVLFELPGAKSLLLVAHNKVFTEKEEMISVIVVKSEECMEGEKKKFIYTDYTIISNFQNL